MLSRNLEQTLHRSLSLASERRHEYATLEHLLLGLADDSDAATVLRACGVDLDKLRSDLGEFLDKDLAGLATDRPGDPSTYGTNSKIYGHGRLFDSIFFRVLAWPRWSRGTRSHQTGPWLVRWGRAV